MSETITAGKSGSLDEAVASNRLISSRWVKRAFDLAFGSLMLLAFLPLGLMISIVIFLADRGAPIYAHKRVGRGGREFYCLKFRTMVPNADALLDDLLLRSPEAVEEWEQYRKLRNDPRIVPVVGAFLRKTSLDELPQIVNVIRGDMSIVGPRPVIWDEVRMYGPAAPLYLSVRPGLTGPWQAGVRSDATFEYRVSQDVQYIENWSLWADVRLIVKTAAMFLRGKTQGAY